MTESMLDSMLKMTLLLVVLIGLFTYMAVSSYASARRREREAHYRNELRKSLIQQWGNESAEKVLELLKEESRNSETARLLEIVKDDRPADPRVRKERLTLAGLVTTALGIGLCVGLQFVAVEKLWMLGFIPLLVGVAILVHAFIFINV